MRPCFSPITFTNASSSAELVTSAAIASASGPNAFAASDALLTFAGDDDIGAFLDELSSGLEADLQLTYPSGLLILGFINSFSAVESLPDEGPHKWSPEMR